MGNNQYLELFIEESREHLQAINENLLALEQQPSNLEIVNNMFRSAHTLKGMSATMGFEQMAHLTHQLEDGLDLVKSGQIAITSAIMDTFFACADKLEAQLNCIIESGSDAGVDVTDVLNQLARSIKGRGNQNQLCGDINVITSNVDPTVIEKALEQGQHVYHVKVAFDPSSSMPAVRAFMVAEAYKGIGDVISCHPSLDDLMGGQLDGEFHLVLASSVDHTVVEQEGFHVSEVANVTVHILDNSVAQLETAASVERTNASAATGKSDSIQDVTKRKNSRSIRVDIERLDTLMNLLSEFVIDRTRLEQLSSSRKDPALSETVQHLSRVAMDLQEIVMKIRMVPIESVFNRFPRMVRDLSKTLGKQVDLQITGAETELDRTLVDEIGEPLVHILRNALDHGLETPEERTSMGKNPTGTLRLSAYQSGNHVYIEIRDDGRGIDRSKILAKAIKRGLIDSGRSTGLSDEQVFDFLFQSGFSTAQTISDISGRGVGLDVVKSKIQSLGGDVIIESTVGEGTAFIIELPLTLSILPAMMVQVSDERYAIPLHSIVQMESVRTGEIRHVHGQEMLSFQGSKIIPLIDLGEKFSVPGRSDTTTHKNIVILRKGEKMVGLVVDQFLGQQDIVLKSLGSYLTEPVYGISGATILGDGQVALILDPNAFIR